MNLKYDKENCSPELKKKLMNELEDLEGRYNFQGSCERPTIRKGAVNFDL